MQQSCLKNSSTETSFSNGTQMIYEGGFKSKNAISRNSYHNASIIFNCLWDVLNF